MTESLSADRIYYDEPRTLEFTAEVTSIREVVRVQGQQVWQIALDRTAFYPTSGGQPHDTGVLIATARSGASLHLPITAVEEDETGEVWHFTSKPLLEGTVVTGRIDAERRLDHMQQHSGQHLLSAVLQRDFGARTLSFHLGTDLSTIDLEGASLREEGLQAAQLEANRIIAEALPVTVRSVSPAEAEAMLQAGLLRKLPPRSGPIRIVEIAGVDTNACGGTHVATTAEIGPLFLRGTEQVRGNLRLSFVCGRRAMTAADHDFRLLREIAQACSTSQEDILTALERTRSENRTLQKERQHLLESLASLQAAQIAAQATGTVTRLLPPDLDAGYARLLASALVRETAVSVALIASQEDERANIVLAAKPGILHCGTALKQTLVPLGARGGGSAELAQGSVALSQWDAVVAALAAGNQVRDAV